ncbi:MAG: glycoside hydrolase family 16 protein [Bacteroidales bacterium]|nr:glycoside hydrolase family 16 protein [Bacteroidales bacterium]
MKKFIYLCALMMLGLNVIGQINLNEGWSNILNEQFTGTGRGWDNRFREQRPASIPADSVWIRRWRVNAIESKLGVTKPGFFHAYQCTNTLFNNGTLNDDKMRLVAQCISYTPLQCDGCYPTGYVLPNPEYHECSTEKNFIFYYTGNIQSYQQSYHYGYYEIECALPIHPGIHTSFWLYGGFKDTITGLKYYEEIDIMEYSKIDWDEDEERGYSSGIWYNMQDIADTNNVKYHYGYKNFHMEESEPDISHMHIYGCEWMPDHVIFYRDGKVTHEFHDEEHIPKYPKYIKTGYAIDDNAVKKINDFLYLPKWFGPDTITINFIRAYQLETDCSTDELVQNVQQLNQIDSMKRSITISNTNGIVLPSTTEKTLRASDYILINGLFEANAGTQLTLMVHECPECATNNERIDDD